MSSPGSADESSNGSSENGLAFSRPTHQLFAALIGGLIGFVQLKCQPLKISVFDTNYTAIVSFFVATFIYALLWVVGTKFPMYQGTMDNVSHPMGALATALLIFMLVPVLGEILICLCAFWLAAAAAAAHAYTKLRPEPALAVEATETNQDGSPV